MRGICKLDTIICDILETIPNGQARLRILLERKAVQTWPIGKGHIKHWTQMLGPSFKTTVEGRSSN